MRVTHVITRLVIGGAQENTVASVTGLRKDGQFNVDLISGPTTGPEGSLAPDLQKETGLLTIVPTLVRNIHPPNDYTTLLRLTQIFRSTAPQIVHTHSGKAGILGRMAAARAGVPIIIHTIHGPSFGSFQGFLPNLIFRSAERRAATVTTHFVSVAEAMTRQYLAAGIGQPDQFTTIPSGFTLEPFLRVDKNLELRRKLAIGDDDIVVGKIARLFKLKGHDDLLAVAPMVVQRCPNVKFLLIGDGAWRERLEKKAAVLGLQRHIIFAGLISPAEIPAYLGAMDLLVHLSRREGLPRALPQALAAGRPVVAYNCDGANEICLPDETGILVEPGNLKSLADSLAQLAQDPDLRNRLGGRGREIVLKRFSVDTMIDSIAKLYRRLAAERQS